MDLEERKEKLASYGDGYNQLVSALERFPKEMWEFRDSHGCWSIHEHIVHIGDTHPGACPIHGRESSGLGKGQPVIFRVG